MSRRPLGRILNLDRVLTPASPSLSLPIAKITNPDVHRLINSVGLRSYANPRRKLTTFGSRTRSSLSFALPAPTRPSAPSPRRRTD